MNTNPLMRDIRRQHPKFFRAVAADARITLAYRAEPHEIQSKIRLVVDILRLAWISDAFLAQILYRAKARMQRFHVPILPTVFHRLAMMHSQVCIGNPVVIEPGIYLAHGQVVIDGFTKIRSGVVIFPWVTVGLKHGILQGPTIENGAQIGTGAKIIGPVTIGAGAIVGANAVVVRDIAQFQTVAGVPARPIN
jgi:serine O-acetyltransferase